MDIFFFVTLIAAAFTGASMGSFLLVTLLYNSLLKSPKNLLTSLDIYRRLYRLNTALCLLAGVCAALLKNQSASLLLAILAASYVFSHSHVLKAIIKTCNMEYQIANQRAYTAWWQIQNLLHIAQFIGAGYAIYLLAAKSPIHL